LAKVCALDSTPSILYSWQVHPARERWQTALLTGFVIALASWLTMELMQQPAWGVFAVTVLVVGCNRFFFPTRYEVTADGITACFPLKTLRYQWTELRRFVFDQSGGFLSPRAKRSFLDEHRGISLLFPGDSTQIIQEIRGRLPREAIVREVSRKKVIPQEGHSSCGG
jgi:hypothetical protein